MRKGKGEGEKYFANLFQFCARGHLWRDDIGAIMSKIRDKFSSISIAVDLNSYHMGSVEAGCGGGKTL
jgi:hypothetical protein